VASKAGAGISSPPIMQNDLGVSGAELHTKGVEHPLHEILDLF
jgi:hypothetical protein